MTTATHEQTDQRRWRAFVGVLSAQAVAWTGTRLAAVALPWFVLTTTDSAVTTGFVVFAQMGPYVIVQALAGPFIDRVGPRRVSIVGDVVATAAMALVPLLHTLGALPVGVLMAVMAVVGAADGPSDAAKGVFIPEITRIARVPLERGTGLSGSLERLAGTVGPAIAGLLVAAWGGVLALWVTAAMFAVGAILIAATAPRRSASAYPADPPTATADDTAEDHKSGESEQQPETLSYGDQLRVGARFLRGDRLLRSIVGMVSVTNLLDAAWTSVLLPVWARESGHGPAVVGLVISVMSGFSIGASVLAAAIGHRLPRRLTYLVGFLVAGAPRFAVLALGAPGWLVIGMHAVSGFASGVLNPILGAVQFERIPATLLGRVKTLSHAAAWSGIPLGGAVGGALVSVVGIAPALLVCGGLYLVATTLPGLQREWSEMDHSHRSG